MSSAYRIKNEESIYYLTLTVRHWIDLFTRASFKWLIVDALKYSQIHKGLTIYAWCLMPSHLHLVVRAEDGHKLSGVIRDFKRFSTMRLLKMIKEEPESRREWLLKGFVNNKDGCSIWQHGNHAKECISEEFTMQKIEYIHQNPIQSQIVRQPEHYLFSSAMDYLNLEHFGREIRPESLLLIDLL